MVKDNVFYIFPPIEADEVLSYSFMSIRLMVMPILFHFSLN